jgi:mannose-1-phosphate guanylyltransferase
MKAFLLAAGHGTRLRPYTDCIPKCLLPVQGVPMLEIWLSLCREHGISEVLVNTHAHSAAVVDFAKRWKNGVRVTVKEEPELFGSAGTLRVNREWVEGEDKFWVFYADVLTNTNLRKMLEFHSELNSGFHSELDPEFRSKTFAATLGVYSVPDPQRCGVISTNEHQVITDFVEKPAHPKTNWAFAGIMIGTPELLDAIPEKAGADIAFDVLPRLVGRMRAYPISEFVLDIGTIENYQAAQNKWAA